MYNNPVIDIENFVFVNAYKDLRSAVETKRNAMEVFSLSAKDMTQSLEKMQQEFSSVKKALDDKIEMQKKIGRISSKKDASSE